MQASNHGKLAMPCLPPPWRSHSPPRPPTARGSYEEKVMKKVVSAFAKGQEAVKTSLGKQGFTWSAEPGRKPRSDTHARHGGLQSTI